jgi:hypothetical protein
LLVEALYYKPEGGEHGYLVSGLYPLSSVQKNKSFSFEHWTMDRVQKPNNHVQHTPSSESFQAYQKVVVAGSIPDEVIGFCNLPNPSSCTMALGLTQPLTEIGTRNFPGGKGRPMYKADNFTAICEPVV